jgi:hypothetical protein
MGQEELYNIGRSIGGMELRIQSLQTAVQELQEEVAHLRTVAVLKDDAKNG